jgi:hypothetical protein
LCYKRQALFNHLLVRRAEIIRRLLKDGQRHGADTEVCVNSLVDARVFVYHPSILYTNYPPDHKHFVEHYYRHIKIKKRIIANPLHKTVPAY